MDKKRREEEKDEIALIGCDDFPLLLIIVTRLH
jgi:hypothetical protein